MIRMNQQGAAMPNASQTSDEQSQQLFVQTMVLAPEVYKEIGGDQVPDEFVSAMKQVQQNPDMIQAVAKQYPEVIAVCQELFVNNQEQIIAKAQQLQSAKSFKKGGKFAFFKRCFGNGGSISADCGCKDIKTTAQKTYPVSAAKLLASKFSK